MVVSKHKAHGLRLVRNVVLVEAVALLTLVALLWLYQPASAQSAFWGGLVFLVPNAYFTLYAFRYSGAQSALTVALSLHRGQTGKLVLVAAGFALAFRFIQPLHPGYLFAGYLFVLAVHLAVAAKISERFGAVQRDAAAGSEDEL